jgi:hypothetical protein
MPRDPETTSLARSIDSTWRLAVASGHFCRRKQVAMVCIDYAETPGEQGAIAQWIAEIERLSAGEFRAMLHPPTKAEDIELRELLKRAAYFADYAMIYPSLRPHGPPPGSYRPFLSAAILRQYLEYPGVG